MVISGRFWALLTVRSEMLELSLLGRPGASRDGLPLDAVRGAKAWTLLAFLLLAERPVERSHLTAMFFPDAADPAGALRWNLSQLRRGLGVTLEGDPVELTLPADTRVDLTVLAEGGSEEAAAVAGQGRRLLDGVTVGDHEPFVLWLEGERRHLDSLAADVLREAAVARLARGDVMGAAELAERVLALDPFDENAAAVLIRALREAGRVGEALAVADGTAERLRTELGVEPSSMLWSAAHASTGGTASIGGRTAIEAQLDAGEAALAAGVPDAGLDALREALGGARAIAEPALLARCLTALGSALIHAVRGSDQDGIALLHQAIPLATSAGLSDVCAQAHRELGYVDLLRGRYERAQRWFTQATGHAGADEEELAWIVAFAGTGRTDVADYAAATEMLDEAVERATAGAAQQALAYAHAMRGRLRLLVEDETGAIDDLDRSIRLARTVWRAFGPLPQSLRAEVAYRRGDMDGAAAILGPALATSRQVADPCWEAMALRGLGLASVGRGDLRGGLELLHDAPRQCRRFPDTYLWVEVYGLDALADVTSARGLAGADDHIDALEKVSTSHGMRALTENAATYRKR